jgi:hypothetical protein
MHTPRALFWLPFESESYVTTDGQLASLSWNKALVWGFPSPVALATIIVFYCLRFETSIFVASYDSQDYGGIIRPHLHTGLSHSGSESGSYITADGSRSVSLGIKHPSGAYDQIFITVRQVRVCWCGALSLTRGPIGRLHLLMVLANAVGFWGPSPLVVATVFYCLRFETSHFVASYDSQGYGGGIRSRPLLIWNC